MRQPLLFFCDRIRVSKGFYVLSPLLRRGSCHVPPDVSLSKCSGKDLQQGTATALMTASMLHDGLVRTSMSEHCGIQSEH